MSIIYYSYIHTEVDCAFWRSTPPTRFGNSRPQVWVFMKQLYDKESSLCDTPWCSGLKNSKLWTVIGFLGCFCSPVIWAVRGEKVKALINAWRLILHLVFSIKSLSESLNGGNLFKIRKNTHSGPNVHWETIKVMLIHEARFKGWYNFLLIIDLLACFFCQTVSLGSHQPGVVQPAYNNAIKMLVCCIGVPLFTSVHTTFRLLLSSTIFIYFFLIFNNRT